MREDRIKRLVDHLEQESEKLDPADAGELNPVGEEAEPAEEKPAAETKPVVPAAPVQPVAKGNYYAGMLKGKLAGVIVLCLFIWLFTPKR